MNAHPPAPVISVIILNWNAARWIPRCLESLRRQTIFSQVEIIFTDNASADGSEKVACDYMAGWPNGKIIQTGGNFGFGGGCNRGAASACGKYLFFVNPDIWLEPACLEELAAAGDQNSATAVAAKIMDYADDSVQWWLDDGFDAFGLVVNARPGTQRTTTFCASTFAFVRADAFRQLGGFDDEFFLYGEEADLAWRIWISGGKVTAAPKALVHHRGEAAVNPNGGEIIVEFRTSERKRYYANRNHMLALLKNSQHILLLTAVTFAGLLLLEGFFWLLIKRRWALMRTTCLEPLMDCWRLRDHVRAKRRQAREFRRHGDWWMLRFLCWRLGRWADFKKVFKFGLPKIG
jgi:GT2 family glycosyltransferase